MPDQDQLGHYDEAVEALLRDLTEADSQRFEPPVDLWGLIEADTVGEPDTEGSRLSVESGGAEVVSLSRRRISRATMTVIAAAAALIVVVGVAVLASGGGGSETVVARAQLVYDAESFDSLGAGALAQVALVDAEGTLRIDVERSSLPQPVGEDADLELWLIEPDADGNVAGIVSLGLVDPVDPGSFQIPADYDPDEFFVVDISVEPHDGDPNHSGRSILRGPLTPV